jgi:hypothetical protein
MKSEAGLAIFQRLWTAVAVRSADLTNIQALWTKPRAELLASITLKTLPVFQRILEQVRA